MKIVSWNVNGIRAAWGHGLSAFLDDSDADIYAFQETKTDEPIPMIEIEGYHAYWSFCGKKKGYSGTLCLTKKEPLNVRYDMGNANFDTEGRIITLEFEDFFFVNCYVPNSQHSESRRDYRSTWDLMLIQYLTNLRFQKPTILCGDFNVPISDDDIYEESKWVEINAEGFQSTEREALLAIVENGFTDTYRYIHPDERGKYTWWSNRRFKRKENRGWRLDYFFVSNRIKEKIKESTMLSDVFGSDHCPIMLDIEIEKMGLSAQESQAKSRFSYTYSDLLRLEERGIPLSHIKRTDMTNLWGSVNWEKAEKHLETMQMALAKSAYTRDPDLIEKWQRKIVSSIDAKLLAVRHVCSNSGGMGVDCIKWSSAHEKMSAALSLDSRGYHAMPARLLLVKSKNGKERRIHIETYYDRAMQCLYAFALDPIAESWGDRKSFSYRKGRSFFDLNEYIKKGLSGDDAPTWVFMGDVRKCYENISHGWIVRNIPMASRILWQFLEAGYVFGGELFPTDVGVGIGCSISPIVANMTLDGMQEYVYERLYPAGKIDYADGNMVRYADDIIFMARTKETAEKIMDYAGDFLRERGLELSKEKCQIVNIKDGFDFMSRTYYKRGNQVFSRPSQASIERFMGTLKETIENYRGSQKSLIEKINHKIDGWISYHKVGEADEAFRKMDVYIGALLLELCETKHPKWSREKILERYWYVDFEGRHRYALPSKREIHVKCLADTLLTDYQPVKTNVNPYIDIDYIEARSKERAISNVVGVYRTIWNRQEGRCYYCGHRILRDEERTIVEACASRSRFASRMAYVHKRCIYCSFDYIDAGDVPASLTDVMKLLEKLDEGRRKPIGQRLMPLSEFFRTCDKNSVTLTFKQIEEIMGDSLGATAMRKEFWYRTGFGNISQCWLDNGYEIKTLHLEGRLRVVFNLTSRSKKTASIEIPEVLRYGRVPNDAKYELENYFQYIIKKYGL